MLEELAGVAKGGGRQNSFTGQASSLGLRKDVGYKEMFSIAPASQSDSAPHVEYSWQTPAAENRH